MSQPWKQIERRGVCHYPDVSDEDITIVSVDVFEAPYWGENAERYRGRTWYMVIFEKPSPYTFTCMSSEPFASLEEAVKFAETQVPTGIVWDEGAC